MGIVKSKVAQAMESNVTVVSYENLNMDHISKLCGEGYPKARVIRALGITGNDLNMARDILKEFSGPKTSRT